MSTPSERSASGVPEHGPYGITVAPGASRALEHGLPEAVAAAAIEFITRPLLENPHRVGKLLRGELAGTYSARRGSYRILYRIDEERREVFVLLIDHRGRVYRSR